MTYAHAIIIAAGMVGAAVIFSGGTSAGVAEVGTYEMFGNSELSSALRMDTRTGEMTLCRVRLEVPGKIGVDCGDR